MIHTKLRLLLLAEDRMIPWAKRSHVYFGSNDEIENQTATCVPVLVTNNKKSQVFDLSSIIIIVTNVVPLKQQQR